MTYSGQQLANHWIYKNFGILGDAVVAFRGPCDVPMEHMVDIEDVLHEDLIYSIDMLHFIIEIFATSLREGVLVQRLFMSVIQEKLNCLLLEQGNTEDMIVRRGDDLFFQDRKKLSVSICTVSPTSVIIHAGLNIRSEGAPVEAAGLQSELGLENFQALAMTCMKTLCDEWEDINRSCCKVRGVL
jgi:hypothetical protein